MIILKTKPIDLITILSKQWFYIVYIKLYIDLVKKHGMERKSDYIKWKINNPKPEFL